jgi:hypothetical protein
MMPGLKSPSCSPIINKMKKITLLLALVTTMLTGCLDSFEEFTISADGSGTYTSSLDMSGMMEMLEMMAAMDNSGSDELKKISEQDVDSLIMMSSIVDTATDLSAEQKRLFRDATMNINISQKKKLFKMGMVYPFRSLEDVKKIIDYNEAGNGVGLYGNKSDDKNPLAAMQGQAGLPTGSGYFITTIKNGLIERKVDEKKVEALKTEKGKNDFAQAEEMMENMTFTSVVNLPAPVKKLTGTKAILSADKKTVRIRYTMADLMKDPAALGFKIEY